MVVIYVVFVDLFLSTGGRDRSRSRGRGSWGGRDRDRDWAPKKTEFRDGDWECPKCSFHNFAR